MALRAAQAGLSVMLAEERHLGGTCLNEGCIPTKCLCASAEVLHTLGRADQFGIMANTAPQVDMGRVQERKNQVVQQLKDGVQSLLQMQGVTVCMGRATLLPDKVVQVAGEQYQARHVVLATGSQPARLPIPGADLPGVLDSSQLLQLDAVPARLAVIGGGVIGLEFASVFNAFGAEVTVLEYCKEVLPNFDAEMAKRLRMALKKRGVTFCTGTAVNGIARADDGVLTVTAEQKGKPLSTEADVVLMAVGRKPNLDPSELDALGIAYTRRGIVVDEHLQTSQPGIYAIGDVNGLCQLAHAATHQGYTALNHIMGSADDTGRTALIPAAVFTMPEAAMVGLTEQAAQEQGLVVHTYKSYYRSNGKALAMGEAGDGFVKLLSDSQDRIVGAHVLGAHAADLIHEAMAWISQGATVEQLSHAVHAHPTLSELMHVTL